MQSYLKKETKTGISTQYLYKKRHDWKLNLYQMERADTLLVLNKTDLVEKTKMFDTDDLDKNEVSYALDLKETYITNQYEAFIELRELKLLEVKSKTQRKSLYGSSPLIHLGMKYKPQIEAQALKWNPFIGVHYRKRYPIEDGIYLGIFLKYSDHIPFQFTGKISKDFMTLIPQFVTKYIHFIYTYKTPIHNPQEEIWVPAMHSVSLSIPFP